MCIVKVHKKAADRIFMTPARADIDAGGQFVPEDIINQVSVSLLIFILGI